MLVLLATAAVEGDPARVQRRAQGVAVHVAEHQHAQAVGILDDGRDQAVDLAPVQ